MLERGEVRTLFPITGIGQIFREIALVFVGNALQHIQILVFRQGAGMTVKQPANEAEHLGVNLAVN